MKTKYQATQEALRQFEMTDELTTDKEVVLSIIEAYESLIESTYYLLDYCTTQRDAIVQCSRIKEIAKARGYYDYSFYYTINWGDTLLSIAARYQTTVEAILKLNPYISNKDKIYAGDALKMPLGCV